MTNKDLINIAVCWIKMHLAQEGSDDYKDNFWAFDELNELCDNDPDTGFEVVDLIRSQNESDIILSNLAAGPVEDLLIQHGERYIDRLEETAKTDSQLRKLLGAVWQNTMSDGLWGRIKVISSKSW